MPTNPKPAHTPEPWSQSGDYVLGPIPGETVATTIVHAHHPGRSAINAARIVACVNACAGHPDLSKVAIVDAAALQAAKDAMGRALRRDDGSSPRMDELREALAALGG